MNERPEWLPNHLGHQVYSSDVLEKIYLVFKKDLIWSPPLYDGNRVTPANRNLLRGKEKTFWHIISEGDDDGDRLISLVRCNLVNWIKPIIENSIDRRVLVWTKIHDRKLRIKFWLTIEDYLVIVQSGPQSHKLITGYPTSYKSTRKKLTREYEFFLKSQKPPT